jgi:four helix bundle protein
MPSYKDLIAWKKGMQLAREVYKVTQDFPKQETYGLTSQLRRAAVSVPSNIAEGQARFSRREFQRFLSTSRGSLVEVETQLLLARDLSYIKEADCRRVLAICTELGRIINGLRASLDEKMQSPSRPNF